MTKQTAGSLVDQARAGYVRRVPDPTDARAMLVQAADRGAAALVVARRVEAQVEAGWTAHPGREEADRLRKALTRLREITGPFR